MADIPDPVTDSGMFTHRHADNIEHEEGSGGAMIVTIVFPTVKEPDPVDAFDLSELISAPKTFEMPQTEVNHEQYHGSITWKVSDVVHAGAFEAEKVYTAVFTLSPKPGWYFEDVEDEEDYEFTHDDAAEEGSISCTANDDGTVTVTITFSGTAVPDPYPLAGTWIHKNESNWDKFIFTGADWILSHSRDSGNTYADDTKGIYSGSDSTFSLIITHCRDGSDWIEYESEYLATLSDDTFTIGDSPYIKQ